MVANNCNIIDSKLNLIIIIILSTQDDLFKCCIKCHENYPSTNAE